MVAKQWLRSDEEFFEQLFAYLKEKFSMQVPDEYWMQKKTEQAIYNETIVALENVYKVLRKIENGSFYKRADYDKAKQLNDANKIQEITDFYQRLLFFRNEKFSYALSIFNEFYDWDADVSQFFIFIKKNDVKEKFEELWLKNAKSEKSINLDMVFGFVNEYRNFIQEELVEPLIQNLKNAGESPVHTTNLEDEKNKLTPDSQNMEEYNFVLDQIEKQNIIYRQLNENFRRLQTQKIGICVFDIILPSRFKYEDNNSKNMSTGYLRRLLDNLEFAFSKDDGVLMRVNHTHIISKNRVMFSFLLIYKVKNYKNPQDVFDYYKQQIDSELGGVLSFDVKFINREEMIRKVYPTENFIGELRTDKQKEAFREKFLRYFYSSIFILQADKVVDFVENRTIENRYLNDFKFYEEKIYVAVDSQKKLKGRPINDSVEKVNKETLQDLLTEEIAQDAKKHFPLTDVSSEGLHRLKIMTFLYRQHFSLKSINKNKRKLDIIHIVSLVESLRKTEKSIEAFVSVKAYIEKLIQVEKFITGMMYINSFHGFRSMQAKNNFKAKPAFSKLSLPVRQVLLISKTIKDLNDRDFPIHLQTEAITLLKKFGDILPEDTKLNELDIVEDNFKKYKLNYLLPLLKKERLFFKKALKEEEGIKKYLRQVFESNVVVFRLILDCDTFDFDKDSARIFDEMFREFIENLKRRHTENFKLLGHVGRYVPQMNGHYIDATFFFQFDESIDIESKALIKAVQEYWTNYVSNKDEQIRTRDQKIGKKYTVNKTNPFEILRGQKLRAISTNVVKTEIELNHLCVYTHKGQRKTQKKLIEKIAMFYAYCPLILVNEKDIESLPRTNSLILGRVRKPHVKKIKDVVESPPSNEDESETNSQTQDVDKSNDSNTLDQVALDSPTISNNNWTI